MQVGIFLGQSREKQSQERCDSDAHLSVVVTEAAFKSRMVPSIPFLMTCCIVPDAP